MSYVQTLGECVQGVLLLYLSFRKTLFRKCVTIICELLPNYLWDSVGNLLYLCQILSKNASWHPDFVKVCDCDCYVMLCMLCNVQCDACNIISQIAGAVNCLKNIQMYSIYTCGTCWWYQKKGMERKYSTANKKVHYSVIESVIRANVLR